MFDSKSPIVKYVGYGVIFFFGLVITISMVGTDFISPTSGDKSIAAMINGKKVHVLKFLRYRDKYFPNMKGKGMENLIFDRFIQELLLLEKAKELGFDATDNRIAEFIKKNYKSPGAKNFNPDELKSYLKRAGLSNKEFFKQVKDDIIKRDFMLAFQTGLSISSEEVNTRYSIDNSKIQIKYSFLSNKDLKKRHKDKLAVTETEISEEMKKNKKDLKDPKTDKSRIKKKLEGKKFEAIKNDLTNKINTLALKHGSFNEAAVILNGKISTSNIFKAGDKIKEGKKKGKPLTQISNSKIFREACLAIKTESTSPLISTPSGFYIFTPIQKDVKNLEPSEKEYGEIVKKVKNEISGTAYQNLMQYLTENSKIEKYLKTN